MKLQQIAKQFRKPTVEINEIFYTRWSPRAMTGEEMTKEEILPLIEAARWAPSSRNDQPWRFIVYLGKEKEKLISCMFETNQIWAKKAGALILIVSKKNYEHNNLPNSCHAFDSGAAWMSLALEGASRGYALRAIGGFDYEQARKVAKISEEYELRIMCAVGKLADKSTLPAEIASKEVVSQRKELKEIVSWNKFQFS